MRAGHVAELPTHRFGNTPASQSAPASDAAVDDGQLLDELEGLFANDASLAAAEKQDQETKLDGAFTSFKSVTMLDPVQCKQRLCRLTIRVPSADDLNEVLGAMVGVPSRTNPGAKALLPYSLTNPRHVIGSDGSATATVFIRKVPWDVLRAR